MPEIVSRFCEVPGCAAEDEAISPNRKTILVTSPGQVPPPVVHNYGVQPTVRPPIMCPRHRAVLMASLAQVDQLQAASLARANAEEAATGVPATET